MSAPPRPVSPDRLPGVLADLIDAVPSEGAALRVGVDGHPATDPAGLADALAGRLRALGRPALRVGADWFLRPASVRLERGRTDLDAYYDDRLDVAALRRELLDPLGPGGNGRYLPTLWDPGTDRATRAGYSTAPGRAVLLLDGSLLLGRGLPIDLTVHLRLSSAAVHRRADPDERWVLPAYERYRAEVDPDRSADVVVRLDDPRHPALTVRERPDIIPRRASP